MNDLFTPHPENKEKDAAQRIKEEAERIELERGKKPKVPENIFSRPIDVTQSEEARRSRFRTVVIEALLFGAFLTAITAIYSFTGIDLKLNPESENKSPSIVFFITEFVVFSGLVGVGDYFLTEKRVNEYNQKMAGVSFNLDDEIKKALEEQEADGISKEDAAALNNSNGEEKPVPKEIPLTIKDVSESKSLTDKAFEAYDNETLAGKIKTCKGVILDSVGFETVILNVSEFSVPEEYAKNAVGIKLFDEVKKAAMAEGLGAIVVSSEANQKYGLCLSDSSKYGIKSAVPTCICEVYPGALMGVNGQLQ